MLISKFLKWLLPLFTIIITCSSLETEVREADASKPLVKRNVERQRVRRTRNRWANFRRMNNQSTWLSYTPPTPNPDEVDCHIEVEVRRTVDGRCVRLGGQFHTAVCQSGMHLDFFNNDCEAILAQRETGDAMPYRRQAPTGQADGASNGEH